MTDEQRKEHFKQLLESVREEADQRRKASAYDELLAAAERVMRSVRSQSEAIVKRGRGER